jgi:2C-methyl-D-erythritol 2,4-cyclodiphosphate synthase
MVHVGIGYDVHALVAGRKLILWESLAQQPAFRGNASRLFAA